MAITHGSSVRIDAADLVATAGAACTLAELDTALAAHGVWIALDPPGPATRSLGAALGVGAGGPLAALYGPPRDQVIGLAFVAGDGTRVKTGGRVVKNVAGFDIAKLVIGGYGAFGTIEEAHLRLRARAESDRTRGWTGTRASLAAACTRLQTSGAMLAACEVMSPDLSSGLGGPAQWTVFARAIGTVAGVEEELAAAAECLGPAEPAAVPDDLWRRWREVVGAWPAAVRIGADPDAWADAAALAAELGAGARSVTAPRGTVRAAFPAGDGAAIRQLRSAAAARGWPVTVERADAPTLRAVGIWGTLDAGTMKLARALRAALGAGGTQGVPLWPEDGTTA